MSTASIVGSVLIGLWSLICAGWATQQGNGKLLYDGPAKGAVIAVGVTDQPDDVELKSLASFGSLRHIVNGFSCLVLMLLTG